VGEVDVAEIRWAGVTWEKPLPAETGRFSGIVERNLDMKKEAEEDQGMSEGNDDGTALYQRRSVLHNNSILVGEPKSGASPISSNDKTSCRSSESPLEILRRTNRGAMAVCRLQMPRANTLAGYRFIFLLLDA
jgi:hypothetical protein